MEKSLSPIGSGHIESKETFGNEEQLIHSQNLDNPQRAFTFSQDQINQKNYMSRSTIQPSMSGGPLPEFMNN